MSEKEFQLQTGLWLSNARNLAIAVPSIDFLGWHGEHFAIVRGGTDAYCNRVVELKELPTRRRLDCGKGVDLGSDDATWLERKDVPTDYELPSLE